MLYKAISKKHFPVNDAIRAPQVLVIGATGEQLGVLDTAEAIRQAKNQGLDLVCVSPLANPPVCKIIDFGKFLYKQAKEDRKSKAKAKKTELKGVRLTLKMGQHDRDIRRKQAQKFLDQGDKVKVEMILRGRERSRGDMARQLIEEFIRSLDGNIAKEGNLSAQGGRLSLTIYKK